jgi:hypothetical protein
VVWAAVLLVGGKQDDSFAFGEVIDQDDILSLMKKSMVGAGSVSSS